MELKHESIYTLSSLVWRALNPTWSILICFSREGGGVLAPGFLRSLYRRVQGILRSLIWRIMRRWKDDEFLLGFTFYGVQTSRKGFHELFSWNFWTSGGVMYEKFMSDFAHRDSAPWQVQLFISFVNFRATCLRAACSISYIFFHVRWY